MPRFRNFSANIRFSLAAPVRAARLRFFRGSMRFRPCIDLHQGQVKQIVGSTLSDDSAGLVTNFVASQPPAHFAAMYGADGLVGGHVIMLGPGNAGAAADALAAYPGGLQLGGGITADSAAAWLAKGAAKVIVTSYLFDQGELSVPHLAALRDAVGAEHVVLDLSCRLCEGRYCVVINRWQTFTNLFLTPEALQELAAYGSELLVHAVDVEGKQEGIDDNLVAWLARHSPLPVTYAGGVRSLADVRRVRGAGAGRVDVTVGSALDIFGGQGVRYAELVGLDRRWRAGHDD